MISSTVTFDPDISIAFVGQTSAQIPHKSHKSVFVIIPSEVRVNAFTGQFSTQVSQPMHFDFEYNFCRWGDIPSGLWHQTQLSGQPFKKIVIRIPGPSLMEYGLMSKIRAFAKFLKVEIPKN